MLCKFRNCTKALSEFEMFVSGYCRKHQIEIQDAKCKVCIYKNTNGIWIEYRTIPLNDELFNLYSTTEGIANQEFFKYDFIKEGSTTKTIYSYSPSNFD